MENSSYPKRPRFGRELFVSAPFCTCPKCGGSRFGILSVNSDHYTRECLDCGHRESRVLPPLKKRIVYLDQLVISELAKLLDAECTGHSEVTRSPFWLAAYEGLTRSHRLQLIVCPESVAHREESLVSKDPPAESLQDIYEYFSSGCHFEDPETVMRYQIERDFEAWVQGKPIPGIYVEREMVVSGRLDDWDESLSVRVNFGRSPSEAVSLAAAVKARHARLLGVFAHWQANRPTFDTSFEAEARALGQLIITTYQRYFRRYAELQEELSSTGHLSDAQLAESLPPMAVYLIDEMAKILVEHGTSQADTPLRIRGYFGSDRFLQVPYVRLSSMLFASLARKAGAGQRREPSPGTYTDVATIASLLPFCDAMFLDREMTGLLKEQPLRKEVERYGTRIFSKADEESFLAYLSDLGRGCPPAQLAAVEDVYGADYAKPWMGLIESRKRDRSRRAASKRSEGADEGTAAH